jgi:hypothetical protein
LKPHLCKQWCIARVDGEFLARMDNVLQLYALPYNEQYPLICFDERPCQLLGDTHGPLPMAEGRSKRQHYGYERKGTCSMLVAFEPGAGKRFVQVVEQRTKKEYAAFMSELAAQYPNAKRITIIQDNLSTHKKGAFYENLPANEAFQLAQLLDFNYTPVGASWLNMVEIELSVIAKQCLHRRIPTVEKLTSEVTQLVKERNEIKATVNWQFTRQKAQEKLAKWYDKIYSKT